jgi:hypothetical protein
MCLTLTIYVIFVTDIMANGQQMCRRIELDNQLK